MRQGAKAARQKERKRKHRGYPQGLPSSSENCFITRCHLPGSCSQNSHSCWAAADGRAGWKLHLDLARLSWAPEVQSWTRSHILSALWLGWAPQLLLRGLSLSEVEVGTVLYWPGVSSLLGTGREGP